MNNPIQRDENAPARTRPIEVWNKWLAQALTFLIVFGPGLIVMEADNDAGAVSTYVRAGAQYGTHLLWLPLLLLPICYFVLVALALNELGIKPIFGVPVAAVALAAVGLPSWHASDLTGRWMFLVMVMGGAATTIRQLLRGMTRRESYLGSLSAPARRELRAMAMHAPVKVMAVAS